MKFNKIWLTKRWIWRANLLLESWELYDEIKEIDFLKLIEKIKKAEYNWEKVNFEWYKNIC